MSSTETEPAAAASTSPPPVEEQAAASKVQQHTKPSTPLEKEEDTIKSAEPAGEKVEEDQPVETDTVKGTPEVSGEDRLGMFICQTFPTIGCSSSC